MNKYIFLLAVAIITTLSASAQLDEYAVASSLGRGIWLTGFSGIVKRNDVTTITLQLNANKEYRIQFSGDENTTMSVDGIILSGNLDGLTIETTTSRTLVLKVSSTARRGKYSYALLFL